jgi:pimeloyl-ACP methyl ester carboxylesterase
VGEIGGQDGVVAPEIGRAAAALIPTAQLEEVPDCGHAPFLEDAPRYDAVLRAFLAERTQ